MNRLIIASLLTILGITILGGVVWLDQWANHNLKGDPMLVAMRLWCCLMFIFISLGTCAPTAWILIKWERNKDAD